MGKYIELLMNKDNISGLVQQDVTPLLTHSSYVFLALIHQND